MTTPIPDGTTIGCMKDTAPGDIVKIWLTGLRRWTNIEKVILPHSFDTRRGFVACAARLDPMDIGHIRANTLCMWILRTWDLPAIVLPCGEYPAA